ncbi:hypothetical protein OROGR_004163 [Orobanche gracilis]
MRNGNSKGKKNSYKMVEFAYRTPLGLDPLLCTGAQTVCCAVHRR